MKLSKDLQIKLNDFLETKDKKLLILKNKLGINKLEFSKKEIDEIQKIYETNFDIELRKYVYVYIGEALIHNCGGQWSVGKLQKDEAYGYPIILYYGNKEKDNPRICPEIWLYKLEKGTLRSPISQLIDYCKD